MKITMLKKLQCWMEYRIEKGDPLLRLWCSIIPNLNTGVYYNSATTQTINHTSDGRGDKKYKKKRKTVQDQTSVEWQKVKTRKSAVRRIVSLRSPRNWNTVVSTQSKSGRITTENDFGVFAFLIFDLEPKLQREIQWRTRNVLVFLSSSSSSSLYLFHSHNAVK